MKKSANIIQKSSENFYYLLLIKRNSYKSFFIILFVIFISSLNASAQQCFFHLSTADNTESVNKEGRTYFVELQNKGNEVANINLTVLNSNAEINPDKTDNSKNVNLTATILSEDGLTILNNVQLQPNQILKFLVKITVPVGTSIEHWNSMLLKATTDLCPDYSSTLKLHTFIPNQNDK